MISLKLLTWSTNLSCMCMHHLSDFQVFTALRQAWKCFQVPMARLAETQHFEPRCNWQKMHDRLFGWIDDSFSYWCVLVERSLKAPACMRVRFLPTTLQHHILLSSLPAGQTHRCRSSRLYFHTSYPSVLLFRSPGRWGYHDRWRLLQGEEKNGSVS